MNGRMDTGRIGRAILVAALAWIPWGTLGAAQIPDTFTNLQFFDEDIPRDDLIEAMRQFSFALGVRCQFCHAGGDGISFEGVDFGSDDKPAKQRARYMLEMARAINTTLLRGIPDRRQPEVRVECATCHRGVPRPRMIDDILREVIADEGVDAGVQRYRDLRQEFGTGWSYDFGEWVVNDLAREYVAAGNADAAVALMRMNSDFHAGSPSVWSGLAEVEIEAGNRDAAVTALERAVELAPDNERLRARLDEVRSGG